MKLHWKGKLTKSNSFPEVEIPDYSKILVGENDSIISNNIAIIPILIMFYFINKFKLMLYPNSHIGISGIIVGIISVILFLPIHELIHCLFCPKNADINIYYSSYGVTCYPLIKCSKYRYIIMALAPAVFIGFIPLILWLFIPARYMFFNSLFITFSILNLSTTVIDIKNAFIALIHVPSNGYIQASGNKVYWFK